MIKHRLRRKQALIPQVHTIKRAAGERLLPLGGARPEQHGRGQGGPAVPRLRGREVAQMQRDLGGPGGVGGRRRRELEEEARAPERHGVFGGLEVDGRRDVAHCGEVLGCHEERVFELVLVCEDAAREREMRVQRACLVVWRWDAVADRQSETGMQAGGLDECGGEGGGVLVMASWEGEHRWLGLVIFADNGQEAGHI